MSHDHILLSAHEAFDLIFAACRSAGAGESTATSLTDAVISAEQRGKPLVGVAHLFDYLEAFEAGRITLDAVPVLSRPAPSIVHVDAAGGIAQLGFDRAFDEFCGLVHKQGVALFAQSNSYTTGELGYYAYRLALSGILSIAACNGPALMTTPDATSSVYCTNPLSFASPIADSEPLLIDQATSAMSYAGIRFAAEKGEQLRDGVAVDKDGVPTRDANTALHGALLPFGGVRGANLALMVEVLAAGLSGANWSLDAPSYLQGAASPGAGLTIISIAATELAPNFDTRLKHQIARLKAHNVYVPGTEKRAQRESSVSDKKIPILKEHMRRLEAIT